MGVAATNTATPITHAYNKVSAAISGHFCVLGANKQVNLL